MSNRRPHGRSASTPRSATASRSARSGSGSRTGWIFGGLLAVVVVAGIIAVVVSSGGDDSGSSSVAAQEIGKVTVSGTPLPSYSASGKDSAVGDTIPTVDGESFDKSAVTISSATSKPQVIAFLAHWCPHCQAEVPRIVAMAKDGVFDGVDVVGVATGTRSDQPNYPPSSWLEGEGWKFPVMVDDADGTAGEAFGLSGYPFLVFVNADGTVAARTSGEISEADLTAMVDDLVAGRTVTVPSAGSSSGA